VDEQTVLFPPEKDARHHGDEGEADEERRSHRDDHNDRQRREEDADKAANEGERKQHHYSREGGGDHRGLHFAGSDDARGALPRSLFKVVDDLVGGHDAVVHDHAARHRERGERENVDRVVHLPYKNEGDDERKGDGGADDERGGKPLQKDPCHGDNEDNTRNKRLRQVVYGVQYELGGVHADMIVDIRGKLLFLQLFQPREHRTAHLDGVGVARLENRHDNGALVEMVPLNVGIFVGIHNLRHVVQMNEHASRRSDDCFAYLVDGGKASGNADVILRRPFFQRAGGNIEVLPLDGGDDGVHGDAEPLQLLRVDTYLNLPLVASVDKHLPHSGDAGDILDDHTLRKVMQPFKRALRCEREREEGDCPRGDAQQNRFFGVGGEVALREVYGIPYIAHLDVEILSPLELNGDHGDVVHRLGEYFVHAFDERKRILQPLRDALLHVPRGGARPGGEDVHHGRLDFGEQIELQPDEDDAAQQ